MRTETRRLNVTWFDLNQGLRRQLKILLLCVRAHAFDAPQMTMSINID